MFQIYFYVNLFRPLEKSHIINNKRLNKKTIETLLNEIYTLDRQENKNRVESFANENDIEKDKSSTSRQCEICKFCYFTKENFRFQHYLCDACHDLTMLSYSLKNMLF